MQNTTCPILQNVNSLRHGQNQEKHKKIRQQDLTFSFRRTFPTEKNKNLDYQSRDLEKGGGCSFLCPKISNGKPWGGHEEIGLSSMRVLAYFWVNYHSILISSCNFSVFRAVSDRLPTTFSLWANPDCARQTIWREEDTRHCIIIDYKTMQRLQIRSWLHWFMFNIVRLLVEKFLETSDENCGRITVTNAVNHDTFWERNKLEVN